MLSVSYLKSKYSKKETLEILNNSDIDCIHVDLMDGVYVSENNFNIDEVLSDLKDIDKLLDIHLMVKNPSLYIDSLSKLHPYIITIHLDIETLEETIELIKEHNILVGIAINPDEDVHLLDKYLGKIDYVLIMSVVPGYGGQEFIPGVLSKVEYLKENNLPIGIDGGVNDKNIDLIKKYNIDIIVSGSFICMSDDIEENIAKLK